ncbi:MAG: hypothetical protein IPP62_14340 [bacterium]|nr:hypothetical protein [bacterium]
MSTTDDIPAVPDDGLPAPEVGQWSLEKYRLVKIYATIFARSMKHKWQHRIYIDLFAGAGRSTIRDTGVIVESSPMIALRNPDPFRRFIDAYHQKDPGSAPLDTFMGTDTWRTAYAAKRPAQSVDIMLTEFYADRMRELHYRYGGVDASVAPPFLNGVHSWPTPPPSNGPNPPGTRSPAARK